MVEHVLLSPCAPAVTVLATRERLELQSTGAPVGIVALTIVSSVSAMVEVLSG